MLSHTGTLWQYLGSFVLYTLATVGIIYGVYWYTRRTSGGSAAAAAAPAEEGQPKLELESTLALEPTKNLYVIRSGNERFLLATTAEGTQLLSRLDNVPTEVTATVPEVTEEAPATPKPWYASEPPAVLARPNAGFKQRFVQSVQWLVSSRLK
ncbi:MAG: hypothetical protein K0Q50_1373 [Vampirovibrio sp.]|jgi:flagellar biogenesis protein FliO|nr:hypothetical protein [Vampirovibrio sp.]